MENQSKNKWKNKWAHQHSRQVAGGDGGEGLRRQGQLRAALGKSIGEFVSKNACVRRNLLNHCRRNALRKSGGKLSAGRPVSH